MFRLRLLRREHQVFLVLVVLEASVLDRFIAVFLKNLCRTGSSSAAVSSGDDEAVLGNLAEPGLDLPDRDVDVSLEAAQLLDFLGLADVEEE